MFLSHKALAVCYSSHRKLTCLLPGAPSGATASAVSPRSRQSVCGGTQLQHAGTAGAGSSTVWPAQPLPGAPAPRACPRADGRPMRSEATWPGSPYRSRPGCSHGHLGSPAGAGGAEVTGHPPPLRPLHRLLQRREACLGTSPVLLGEAAAQVPEATRGVTAAAGMARVTELAVATAAHPAGPRAAASLWLSRGQSHRRRGGGLRARCWAQGGQGT